MTEARVIIVGGGPAGATCAWELRRLGIRDVLILDKSEFPRLKLCAGWITPRVLKSLRLRPDAYPHALLVFDRLHFHFHGKARPIRTRQFSVRRYEFDRWLLERSGVPVENHTVETIRQEKGSYIVDETYRCRYLVGAGGTYCPVYRTFFASRFPRPREKMITTLEIEFPYSYRDKNCYLWFFDNDLAGYSWYVPKGNGYLNLGIGGKLATLKSRGETILQHWDIFVEKLLKRGLITEDPPRPRGYNYYLRQAVPKPRQDNVFLLGDAAGLATLDMGEGIGPAIESGLRAARAIAGHGKYSTRSIPRYSLGAILLGGIGLWS